MAAPVFQSAGTGQNTSSSVATIAVGKPSGTATGDIIIVAISGTESAAMASPPPSGWTELSNSADAATTSATLATYVHIVTNGAGEPSTWTFTSSANGKLAGGALRISGADTTTPVVVAGTPQNDDVQVVVTNGITPGVADCLLVHVASTGAPDTWSASTTTERVDITSGGSGSSGTKCSLFMGTETLSGSGDTGTRTVTSSNSGGTHTWSILLAVQPPVVAVTPHQDYMQMLLAH